MFGHRDKMNYLNGGTDHARGRSRSSRAQRRERERAESERMNELRWQWRCACQSSSLAQMIYTPSGATRTVPVIEHIELGPPIALTVRVRPGQTLTDFVKAAPTIAAAMNVGALHVTLPTPHWARVVLVPAYAMTSADELDREALVGV